MSDLIRATCDIGDVGDCDGPTVAVIAGVRLCVRHSAILDGIVRDARTGGPMAKTRSYEVTVIKKARPRDKSGDVLYRGLCYGRDMVVRHLRKTLERTTNGAPERRDTYLHIDVTIVGHG